MQTLLGICSRARWLEQEFARGESSAVNGYTHVVHESLMARNTTAITSAPSVQNIIVVVVIIIIIILLSAVI